MSTETLKRAVAWYRRPRPENEQNPFAMAMLETLERLALAFERLLKKVRVIEIEDQELLSELRAAGLGGTRWVITDYADGTRYPVQLQSSDGRSYLCRTYQDAESVKAAMEAQEDR